ncbi:MAG: hypothetical protein EP329_08355, partial [Deltaproteobacteria bacterium]
MSGLRLLNAAERPAAAESLAAAFVDDPLFVWAVPDPTRRAAWLRAFMDASLWLAWRDGRTWVADAPGRPGAV